MLRNFKFFTYALLPLALFSACSSDDDSRDERSNAIVIHALENLPEGWNAMSRTTAAELANTYALTVSSRYHKDDESLMKFNKLQLDFDQEEELWMATGQYWPVNGYLDFIGWGSLKALPVSANLVKINDTDDFTKEIGKLSIDLTAEANQLKGTNDILYAFYENVKCDDKPTVPLTFDHALARLQFSLRADNQDAVDHMKIDEMAVENVKMSGKMLVERSAADRTKMVSHWESPVTALKQAMAGFSNKDLTKTDNGDYKTLEDGFFALPHEATTSLIITYHIDNNTQHPHSFRYDFNKLTEKWIAGNRYTYNFTCKLRKIEIDSTNVKEENWDTEIGGGAYEPDWNVEVSTSASEATWKVEIGGQGYEMTWRVEIDVTALESVWVSEMASGAMEGNWNTEMGSGASEGGWKNETGATAGETGWKTETGGTAKEEGWKGETGGNAFEAPWIDGGVIIIGDTVGGNTGNGE